MEEAEGQMEGNSDGKEKQRTGDIKLGGKKMRKLKGNRKEKRRSASKEEKTTWKERQRWRETRTEIKKNRE